MWQISTTMLEVFDPSTEITIHIDPHSIELSAHTPGDLPHEAYWTVNSVMNVKTGLAGEKYSKLKIGK